MFNNPESLNQESSAMETSESSDNLNNNDDNTTNNSQQPQRPQQPYNAPASSSKQVRELKVEDALLYLDQVKMEFSDKPHIYNEFLEIMKNFKAQSINTPGVIERVKTLFRGYNKLILGFNTFLPEGEGYKIELSPEEQNIKQLSSSENVLKKSPVHPLLQKTNVRPTAKPPQQMQQQHAISYVTTIRNRFANEPETYRSFLKILHTYQKEQKGIKDVLEQVSLLFADHPDLLMEFTYFLPDAVQDQAKERLHRAARESEIRRRLAVAQQQQTVTAGILPNKRPRVDEEPLIPLWQDAKEMYQTAYQREILALQQLHLQHQMMKKAKKQPRKQQQQPQPPQHNQQQQQRAQDIPNPVEHKNHPLLKNAIFKSQNRPSDSQMSSMDQKSLRAAAKKEALLPSDNGRTTSERMFFDKVKDLLLATSRESWSEFVKCIELFGTDAISKKDLFSLVSDLFGNSTDLFNEFQRLMTTRQEYEANSQDLWFATPLSEVDFSQCRKCSPSYRALPKDYPKLQFSERSEADMGVLNDNWMSIPIGSEESYSFKHMRKNQYEEALFKCEDERFEIDMIIDSNVSVIRILEPLLEELSHVPSIEDSQAGPKGQNSKFILQLENRNFHATHLNAIARVYGDHGSEIIELLKKNPVGTIPILLKRLNEKDIEWRRVRQDLNKTWKEIIDKNFEKSFDHRSFYFRQQDKRFFSTRHLISDIKTGVLEPGLSMDDMRQAGVYFSPLPPTLFSGAADGTQIAITYPNKDFVVHKDIYRMFCHAMEASNFSYVEKEKICVVWRDMVRLFFKLPVHFFQGNESSADGMYSLLRNETDMWPVGSTVVTVFGSGKVVSHRLADGMYEVQLAFGMGYMKSSSILGSEDARNGMRSSIDLHKSGDDALSPDAATDSTSNVFYGTQLFYVFIRIHQTIFNRMSEAKELAVEQEKALNHLKSDERDGDCLVRGRKNYGSFLSQLVAFLDGTIDSSRYEEASRHLLGFKAYCVFTLDKLFQRMLKCVQIMSTDDNMVDMIQLFMHFSSQKRGNANANATDSSDYYKCAQLLTDSSEDLYKMSHVSHTNSFVVGEGVSFIGIQTLARSHVSKTEYGGSDKRHAADDDDDLLK